eukprot:1160628-Pelagomonas_calceolata.AAC.14
MPQLASHPTSHAATIQAASPASCSSVRDPGLSTDSRHVLCAQGMFKLEHGLQSDMIVRVLRTQGAVSLKFFKQLSSK